MPTGPRFAWTRWHRPGMTTWVGSDLRAHRLDIVAVGIDQERGVIGRAVVGARAGAAIVAPAGLQALAVEFRDRRMIGGAERDMRAFALQTLVKIEPERRRALGPKAGAALVLRAQDVTEWRQRRIIEADAGVEIADLEADMVVHDDLHDIALTARGSWTSSSQLRPGRSWKILRCPLLSPFLSPLEACRNFSGGTPAARWKVRTKLDRSLKPTS